MSAVLNEFYFVVVRFISVISSCIFTVPPDVRHVIVQSKFRKSTQASNRAEAIIRANLLVLGCKTAIAKARGTLPDAKDNFWETVRKDHAAAGDQDDEGAILAIEELAQKMAAKFTEPEGGKE